MCTVHFSSRSQWMADMATMTFGPDAGVSAALKSGPTAGEVKSFLNGSGPPCLFVARFVPKDDRPAGGEDDEEKVGVPIASMIVAHTGLAGYPFSTVGMTEIGRLCYFIRNGDVNENVAQGSLCFILISACLMRVF